MTQRNRDSGEWALVDAGGTQVFGQVACYRSFQGPMMVVVPGLHLKFEGQKQHSENGVSDKERLSGCSWLQFRHICHWGLMTQGIQWCLTYWGDLRDCGKQVPEGESPGWPKAVVRPSQLQQVTVLLLRNSFL